MPPAGRRAAPGDPLRRALLGQFAEELWRAERSGTAARGINALLPDLTLDEADEVRRLGDTLRMDDDAVPAGRYVCFARRRELIDRGLDRPCWGYFFSSQRLRAGDSLDMQRYVAPRVCVALAFESERDIDDADETAIRESIAVVRPALLVLDSRVGSWTLSMEEIIADNFLFAGFALGAAMRDVSVDELQLASARIVRGDRRPVTELARASELRGGPLAIVIWLARETLDRGEPIRAGEVVLTGPLMNPVSIDAGDEYTAEIAGLGRDLLLVGLRTH